MPCVHERFLRDDQTPRFVLTGVRHASLFFDIRSYLRQSADLEGSWMFERFQDLHDEMVVYYFSDPNTAFFMKMKFG